MNETATLGGGCFWCTEAIYQKLNGIHSVTSGYMGGATQNPTYKEICTGTTGHAEIIQLTFDPQKITYAELLTWFWRIHDPTTLNRQGNDSGTQYRSVIFYHTDQQKTTAQQSRDALQKAALYPNPIVTEITPANTFYPAEKYHQNYYQDNKTAPYCQILIAPKLKKLDL